MGELFRRAWSIQVGTVLVRPDNVGRELACRFDVEKSTRREPNAAVVRIANLRPSRRRQLEELDEPTIEIVAGYQDDHSLIFSGDARDIYHKKDGATIWTIIESEDAGRAYRRATVQRSFEANTPVSRVLKYAVEALGVGLGNFSQFEATIELTRGGRVYESGTVLSGFAHRQVDRICRGCGLRWSVQNGNLQLRGAGQPAETQSIRLTPGTGLIGSPAKGKKDERTGRAPVTATSLLIPAIYPGRVVVVESDTVSGGYQVKKCRYTGDTSANAWHVQMELEEY